jgi:hypothetical protein
VKLQTDEGFTLSLLFSSSNVIAQLEHEEANEDEAAVEH